MFRKQILAILAAVMLIGAVNVQAAGDWDIYSDAEIHDGDEYWNVRVFDTPPAHTTLDMFGGLVDSMGAFDESTINISEGYVSTLLGYEFSTVNLSGGFVHTLDALDSGTVNVWGDAGVVSLFADGESGVVNMSGGAVYHTGAAGFGTLNLSGGVVSDALWAGDSGIINIYGYDLAKAASGGGYGYGFVYGEWQDGTSFNIDFGSSETYSRVALIPEPSTIFLIFTGGLFLRSYRKSRKGEAIWDD